MKNLILLLLTIVLFGTGNIFAQSPRAINYQGVARDASGNPIVNQSIGLRYSIRSGSPGGTLEYQETQIATTSNLGLFNLKIGTGSPLSGTFSAIDWATNSHFVEVELDPAGGTNYTSLGTSELVSVPYALHATTVENDQVDDADADPSNEIQTLSQSGSTITLSNGGGTANVNDGDADPSNEIQTISTSGSTLNLSNGGGSVSLNDADADPTNELQSLSLSGNTISLSGSGGQVTIPNDGDWIASGNDMYSGNSADVGIGVTNPTAKLSVRNNIDIKSSSNDLSIDLYAIGNTRTGVIYVLGENGNTNALVANLAGSNSNGFMGVYNSAGNSRSQMYVASSGTGVMYTAGANGNANINSSWLTNYVNNGFVAVFDGSGNNQCGAYVNSSNQGVIYGDIKNFRMDHPTQPENEIWYASLEGPEAGAYTRGTSSLVNGKATVTFPEHFELVANATTLTVIVTPLDGSSKGLAVVEKTAQGFEVVELLGGNGTYDFDWEVKGVRQGFENYRVIRPKDEDKPAGLDEQGRAPQGGF